MSMCSECVCACARVQWMRSEGWKEHECYAAHGVDGTDCSYLAYLGQVRASLQAQAHSHSRCDSSPLLSSPLSSTINLTSLAELSCPVLSCLVLCCMRASRAPGFDALSVARRSRTSVRCSTSRLHRRRPASRSPSRSSRVLHCRTC